MEEWGGEGRKGRAINVATAQRQPIDDGDRVRGLYSMVGRLAGLMAGGYGYAEEKM